MKAHTVSSDDLQVAVDEMKVAMNEVVKSAGNLVSNMDWKGMAPKIAAGMILLYSIRNKKIPGIVSSLAIAGISSYISNRMEAKEVK